MTDKSQPIQILTADGELTSSETWFPDSQLPQHPFLIIAITGPQASGKSTLVNSLFSTNFPVASRGSIGIATTRGILATTISHTSHPTLVLDVEGADARTRGRDAKLFSAQSASFVTALADVVIVNMWFHDACRLDSAAYALLTSVLQSCASALVEGAQARTSIVVAVRDFDDQSEQAATEVKEMIRNDVEDLWADVALSAGLPIGEGGTPLEELADLHIFLFPHIRHQGEEYEQVVSSLRDSLYDGQIVTEEHSKNVPADGLPAYASTVWESIATSAADQSLTPTYDGFGERRTDDFYSGEDFAIVAAFRCDEVFSIKLGEASGDIADLMDKVEAGERINDLGRKCDTIVDRALQEYDAETSDFADEPVYERKRKELEVILDTGLMSVYMKNIGISSREALTGFKTSISDEMPVDFALYTADAMFVKQAKEGLRRGCSWTFEAERVDLRNMMNEISEQQRKLRDTQVTSANQQSKAIQFLRMQQAQIQAVQQQAMGGSVGQWNVGAAYRPPDSNVNLSLAYQQGKTNLQVSMVPDESSSLLGPGGFTSGVGPGNLGLSFNVNF